jgi:soluble lytic murein transglycosylase-like protein
MFRSVLDRHARRSRLGLLFAMAVGLGSLQPMSLALAGPTPTPVATATPSAPASRPTSTVTVKISSSATVATADSAQQITIPKSSVGKHTTVVVVAPNGAPTPTPSGITVTTGSGPAPAGGAARATPSPTATPDPLWDARLPSGVSVAEYYETQTKPPTELKLAQPNEFKEPLTTRQQPADVAQAVGPTAAQAQSRSYALNLGAAHVSPSLGLSGFWKVIRYRDLIQGSAELAGADAAIMAALMEVEGSGEGSVSPAGAMGLMQLMPDKFRPGDDPFDPPTNLLRAAQHVKALQERWHVPELVAAAYFGAIDEQGHVTGASDGNVTGFEYIELFRAAYQHYLDGLVKLPNWLASPFGDLSLTSEMIKFGFLGDYGPELAVAIRGEPGLGLYGTSHLALDLQIPDRPDGGRGSAVVAPFNGRIIRTADPVGGPFGIWLESDKLNLRARLMHMDGLVKGIETGVEVKAGQQLGILGAQGTEGFPHLHLAFERLSDGTRVNPALFYRLKDRTDPASLVGRWYDGLPRDLPASPQQDHDARLIPDGDARPAPQQPIRLLITRWGPFELATP